MTYRMKISLALGCAQNVTTEICIGLCRAADENHDGFRMDLLTDASNDAKRLLQSIEDAIAAEAPAVKVVA